MREYIDELLISDEDECPADIGVGENYRGKAGYIVYNKSDIDDAFVRKVKARKYGEPLFILETERCYLREFSLKHGDLDKLYKLYESLKDNPFIEPLYDYEEEAEFQQAYIDNQYRFFEYGLWLVFLKGSDELIGRIGIENRELKSGQTVQEIGYLLGKEYQRKGYAREVCEAVIAYAGEVLSIDTLYAFINDKNELSIAFIEKIGFEEDMEYTRLYEANEEFNKVYRLHP